MSFLKEFTLYQQRLRERGVTVRVLDCIKISLQPKIGKLVNIYDERLLWNYLNTLAEEQLLIHHRKVTNLITEYKFNKEVPMVEEIFNSCNKLEEMVKETNFDPCTEKELSKYFLRSFPKYLFNNGHNYIISLS